MTTFHQRTRVIAVVDSHNNDQPIDISADIISFNTQKTTKTRGRFQIQLVPRRNYINLLHPNDLVNIYVDPGDGHSGFVRLMLGYIDRVERSEEVGDNGETNTRITLIGSDFQKAIEKTSIYFNAHMRQILDERFARSDDGRLRKFFRNDANGSALRNAGLTAYGTPADFVENFMMILMGFGQQWQLPDTYSRARSAISLNRRKRIQRAKDRIPHLLIEKIAALGFNPSAIESQLQNILDTAREESGPTLAEDASVEDKERREAANVLHNSPALIAFRSTLETSDPSYPIGLVDLISFDFIEALAIDGYQANATVWEGGNQTLAQFLYGNTNGIVNELMFDLRPVSISEKGEGGLEEGAYSKYPDETGINVYGAEGFPAATSGVHYEPAIVFREFPYSVVEGIDLSNISFLPASESSSKQSPGFIPFGPIFSTKPYVSGRHIFQYPASLNPTGEKYFASLKPRKHLDVAVLSNTEVQASHLGRSDEDLLNVFQINPRDSSVMMEQFRSVLTNFVPVVNQISIARNGLRQWEGTTQFANFSRRNVAGVVGGEADNAAIRRNLVRWSLLFDHWFQHNAEYLNGSIVTRPRPDIRVGYRLDWIERHESYYVESVQHQWQYPGAMRTTLQVSRGQRNDPFLVYVPPVFLNDFGGTVQQVSGDRGASGRLAKFFKIRATQATLHSTEGLGPHEEGSTDNEIDKADFMRSSGIGGKIIFPNTKDVAAGQTSDDVLNEFLDEINSSDAVHEPLGSGDLDE